MRNIGIEFTPIPFPNKEVIFSLIFLTDREIAAIMGLGKRTVERYMMEIKQELNGTSRVDTLHKGMMKGWLINWEEFNKRCG